MRHKIQIPIALLYTCLAALPTQAATLEQCAAIEDSAQRLQCFDALAQTKLSSHQANTAASEPIETPASNEAAKNTARKEPVNEPPRSYLTRVWNLDGLNSTENNFAKLSPHRASYFIARESTRTNPMPTTPAAGHSAVTPLIINDLETKFQISFKSEIWGQNDWMGFDNLHLWAAYTQQSNWQAFTPNNSSPFRESNYEPELIASVGTGSPSGLKLINLGLLHQSNGQALPLSRSWNRLYAQGGWEWDKFSVLGRGWWRVPESAQQDDNPDITKYLGHGDILMHWEPSKIQSVSLLLRNNLRVNQNYGFMQLDWATPVLLGNFAKLHVQLSSGFGETLIDYNHRQTTLGLGFSFREW